MIEVLRVSIQTVRVRTSMGSTGSNRELRLVRAIKGASKRLQIIAELLFVDINFSQATGLRSAY